MTARNPSGRKGMILLNVLLVVSVAAVVVTLMMTSQEVAIDRTVRFREAAQAKAYARAGEASVIVALRRDAVEAPASDHSREAWSARGSCSSNDRSSGRAGRSRARRSGRTRRSRWSCEGSAGRPRE